MQNINADGKDLVIDNLKSTIEIFNEVDMRCQLGIDSVWQNIEGDICSVYVSWGQAYERLLFKKNVTQVDPSHDFFSEITDIVRNIIGGHEIKNELIAPIDKSLISWKGVEPQMKSFLNVARKRTGLEITLEPKSLGKKSLTKDYAKDWSFVVNYERIYWVIPVTVGKNRIISEDEFHHRVDVIDHFAEVVWNFVFEWATKGVILSTDFVGFGENQECTIGVYKVGENICCPLDVLAQCDRGDYKTRIPLPENVRSMDPKQLTRELESSIKGIIENFNEEGDTKKLPRQHKLKVVL